MTAASRPKRVVIVDADNPLVEVQGEFFWREDHDAALAAARTEAYRSGYRAGWDDAVERRPSTTVTRPQRPAGLRIRRALLLLLLVAGLVIVAITIGQQLIGQH